MMKKEKYIIVDEMTISDLHRVVNEHMANGYLPAGGVFYQNNQHFYMQAMVLAIHKQ